MQPPAIRTEISRRTSAAWEGIRGVPTAATGRRPRGVVGRHAVGSAGPWERGGGSVRAKAEAEESLLASAETSGRSGAAPRRPTAEGRRPSSRGAVEWHAAAVEWPADPKEGGGAPDMGELGLLVSPDLVVSDGWAPGCGPGRDDEDSACRGPRRPTEHGGGARRPGDRVGRTGGASWGSYVAPRPLRRLRLGGRPPTDRIDEVGASWG